MVIYEFGDIVLAAGGTYTSKPRPVLVFQNSQHPTGSSVVVIPFTSISADDIVYRIPCIASRANGLSKDCFLEVDKLGAIKSDWVRKKVGELEPKLVELAQTMACQLLSPAKL